MSSETTSEPTTTTTDPVTALEGGFVSATAAVNGTTIHYLRGGSGPTLVLLHGFPQSWYEWRQVMPRLARRFTVVVPDLRGVGGSTPTPDGYTAANLARDVRELLHTLDSGPAHVVGHDIGGGVAYAYARAFPEHTRTVTVLEMPLPGIETPSAPAIAAPLWHAAFHMTPGLPEALVAGRQATYVRWFFDTFTVDKAAVGDTDLDHYVAAYGDPDRLRAGFELYRALPAAAADNAAHTAPVDLPLLLVGGEHLFGPLMPHLAESLRVNHGWSDVHTHVITDAAHYIVEERPEEVADLIEQHATTH